MPVLYLTKDGELIDSETFWKTPFNHDTDAESIRTGLECKDASRAQQHAKEETDINTIVDRFLKTGALPNVPMPPRYENFEDVFDFQSAMNAIKAAENSFLALPANVRNQFQNDPANFVAYVDAALAAGDLEQLKKWGMTPPDTPPKAALAEDSPKPQGDPKPAEKAQETPKT